MKVLIAIFALLAVTMCAELGTVSLNRKFLGLQGIPTFFHYEDPFMSSHMPMCLGERETVNKILGLDDYYMCNPTALGADYVCDFDFPPDNTAKPKAIITDDQGVIRCALVCSGPASGKCDGRSECKIIPGDSAETGICVY